ncbi:MAG: DUF484 family protein [Gammaproteobacteria bacterium]|nr:DUF484 family protein [Gammaproteobacteria bacterium]
MSQKSPEQELDDSLSWDEAVARYLKEQQDYFERHPELLTHLNLSHDSGSATSLIERQVQVLRDRNNNLARQLDELVSVARDNDGLSQWVHRYSLALMSCNNLETVLDTNITLLIDDLDLEQVVTLFNWSDDSLADRSEFSLAGKDELKQLLSSIFGHEHRPLCGYQASETTMEALFGEALADIQSCALIPLGKKPVAGILALGSNDPTRFQEDMGTLYLSRMGELLEAACRRFQV